MKRLTLLLLLIGSLRVLGGEHYSNFNIGNSVGWQSIDGIWSVIGNSYKIAANSNGGKSVLIGNQFGNLICEADVVVSPGSWETGIIFRAINVGVGDNNYVGYGAAIDQSGKVLLIRGPGYNVIGQANMVISPNVSYRLQVWAISNRIRVFVDGALKIDLDDATYSAGSVGLMSYTAAASFDNILVSTETQNAKRDDFNDGNDNGWERTDGASSFYLSSGKYLSQLGSFKSIMNNTDASDFTYQADVTMQSGYGDAGLLFRISNPGVGEDNYSGYYFSMSGSYGVVLSRGPGYTQLATAWQPTMTGITYHLKVVTLGPRIQCYVDGVLKIDVIDNTYTSGVAGINTYLMNTAYDNIAISQNTEGGLAKRAVTGAGTFGTPPTWKLTSFYNPDFADMATEAAAIRTEFRNAAFGWDFSSIDGGGTGFKAYKFNNTTYNSSDMLYVATHGNDGYFYDYSYNPIYLRGGYGTSSAILTGNTKFLVLSACACLYAGAMFPHDLLRYAPVMKGAHAILGYASIMQYRGVDTELNWTKYFVSKWHGSLVGYSARSGRSFRFDPA